MFFLFRNCATCSFLNRFKLAPAKPSLRICIPSRISSYANVDQRFSDQLLWITLGCPSKGKMSASHTSNVIIKSRVTKRPPILSPGFYSKWSRRTMSFLRASDHSIRAIAGSEPGPLSPNMEAYSKQKSVRFRVSSLSSMPLTNVLKAMGPE